MKAKIIIFLVVAVLILAGLFYWLKPAATLLESKEKVFTLVVEGRKIVSGGSELKVMEGDQVTIKILIDEDEELHLHGYDKSMDLEKDTPAEISFVATVTGRFEFELEDSKTDLGVLEVLPK